MASGMEAILVEALTRLSTPTPFVEGTYGVRRSHRTNVRRDDAPGAHLIDGQDTPTRGTKCQRDGSFSVVIFVRDDAGPAAADPYKLEAYRRLNPETEPWPAGVKVSPGPITIANEIADEDATSLNLEFNCSYETAGPWSLELAS